MANYKHTAVPRNTRITTDDYQCSFSSEKTKKLTFNERNIHQTNKQKGKDYGFMKVTESKTPYPRDEAPVDPILLRQKLWSQVSRRRGSLVEFPSDLDISATAQLSRLSLSTSSESIDTFEEQRRKFYHKEFTLAKQRPLSNVISHITKHHKYQSRDTLMEGIPSDFGLHSLLTGDTGGSQEIDIVQYQK